MYRALLLSWNNIHNTKLCDARTEINTTRPLYKMNFTNLSKMVYLLFLVWTIYQKQYRYTMKNQKKNKNIETIYSAANCCWSTARVPTILITIVIFYIFKVLFKKPPVISIVFGWLFDVLYDFCISRCALVFLWWQLQVIPFKFALNSEFTHRKTTTRE